MKDLEYYMEINDLLKDLFDNKDPYQKPTDISDVINYAIFKNNIFSGLVTDDTDFVSRIVLFNYEKLSIVSYSKNIDKSERSQIINSFVNEGISRIINAVNNATKDFNYRIDFALGMSSFNLKNDLRKILERNIELILILMSFKLSVEVENYLNREGRKVFELAESLDLKIRSREDNLKIYLSRNLDSLSKVDSGHSLVCYHWFDNSFSFLDCKDSNVEQARIELKKETNWKLFRTKERRRSDLSNATLKLNETLKDLQKRKDSAINDLNKEIELMENEIDKLQVLSKREKFDLIGKNVSNSLITSLKIKAGERIRKLLDERLTRVDGSYDLLNIALMQNEFISTIENYRQEFQKNKEELQLTASQIEAMFDELEDEINEEYFK